MSNALLSGIKRSAEGDDVHHFYVDAGQKQTMIGFVDFGVQKAIERGDILATSIEEGVDKYITWLSDIYRDKPAIFQEQLQQYFDHATRPDALMQKFERNVVDPNDETINWSTFSVDPTILDPTTRNVPVRVKTAQTVSGSVNLSYYAGMVVGDVNSLLTPEGRKLMDLQIQDLASSLLAALKAHLARVPLQETVCHYLSPKRINAGMIMPRTVIECENNKALCFNAFGKKNLSFEAILARTATAMIRRNKTPEVLIVPMSKQHALTKGRNERYIHVFAGNAAQTNLQEDTGPESESDTLAGVKLIPIPLVESTRVNNGTAKILTAPVATGSVALFYNESIENGVENFKPGDNSIGMYCWSKDDWVTYHLGNCIGHDLRFHQPGSPKHLDGFVNRELLMEFYGRRNTEDELGQFNKGSGTFQKPDLDKIKENDAESMRKVEDGFAFIHTTPPRTLKQKKSVDPLMVYDEGKQIWYPATVMGQFTDVLTNDEDIERAIDSLCYVCYNELSPSDKADFDAGKDTIKDTIVSFLRRILYLNPVLQNGTLTEAVFISEEIPTEYKKKCKKFETDAIYAALFKETAIPVLKSEIDKELKKALEDILKKTKDQNKDTTIAEQNLSLSQNWSDLFTNLTCYPLHGSKPSEFETDFTRRWKWYVQSEPNRIKLFIALCYLSQPICRQFFEACNSNGVFIPLSGAITRFTEISEMSTPVMTVDGTIGASYVHMFASSTSMAKDTEDTRTKIGARFAAAIPENDMFYPILFSIGGGVSQNRGGSGEDFMVRKLVISSAEEPITSRNDPRLARWREAHLNRPDRCGAFTNLFFLQGSKVGRGEFPLTIDIKGCYQPAQYYPHMTESVDFRERADQLYPGAGFNAWILDTNKTFPGFARTIPPNEFSYNQIAYIQRNNSTANIVETRCKNLYGNIEITGGCHRRGARVPGALEIDMCLNNAN